MNRDDLLVRAGTPIRLAGLDPRPPRAFRNKADARGKLKADIERLAQLQDVFSAAQTHALLIVLQGMDTAGKDGAIKHVMSGINPQGVHVFGFKAPTDEELRHDFLWRCERVLPERGRIAIFNRSYYEEVLAVRVHQQLLDRERLPAKPRGRDLWAERFKEINAFERHLVQNGTQIVKCFLHISKAEQRKRLLERLDDPSKNWKFSKQDLVERGYWDQYLHAYEEMLNGTSTDSAPWYVIPSDRKWFMRTAIADILVAKLGSLDLRYPTSDQKRRAQLKAIKVKLESEQQT
jgi:PPK2 family polyphosphate:nucleotide phosphotransferase